MVVKRFGDLFKNPLLYQPCMKAELDGHMSAVVSGTDMLYIQFCSAFWERCTGDV